MWIGSVCAIVALCFSVKARFALTRGYAAVTRGAVLAGFGVQQLKLDSSDLTLGTASIFLF